MPPKDPQNYSTNEVAMWLVAIGLGSKVETFKEAGVDGSMLVILGSEDFAELGLSGLQGKKLMTSLEFSKSIAEEGGGGGGGADPALVQQLKDENMALRAQLEAYQERDAPAPAPAPSPPPPPARAPSPPPPQQQQARPAPRGHVIRGAAGGAAGGAIKGAVVGAMLGDAGKGAAVGAAAGVTGGALSGLGARRRARMRARGFS